MGRKLKTNSTESVEIEQWAQRHRDELVEHLTYWTIERNITLNWVRSCLRLENEDGTANAIVDIPLQFWEKFDLLPPVRQEDLMTSIAIHIQHLWPVTRLAGKSMTIDIGQFFDAV